MDNMVSEKPASLWSNWKIISGGLLVIAAVIVLIITSTQSTAQYFLTVDELLNSRSENIGKTVRLSGAVQDNSIQYDANNLELTFNIVNIPADQDEINQLGGIARVLHDAAYNPDLEALPVVYHGVRPDLLSTEAQAIVTGALDENGRFIADELLLKCPSRYEEALPSQVQ